MADAIGTSTAPSIACCSGPALADGPPSAADRLSAPDSPGGATCWPAMVAAFEAYDIDRLVELFTAEATWGMPPYTGWVPGALVIVTPIHLNTSSRLPRLAICA